MIQNGQYMSVYGRNTLNNLLAQMSTFQRLQRHQTIQYWSHIHEIESRQRNRQTGTSFGQLPLNYIDSIFA